jgi:protein-tyrosine phosphatase
MAKGYLEKRLKELGRKDIEVSSAGLIPLVGMEATEEAKQVAKEDGIDLSNHRTRMLTETDIRKADLIFVMERRHEEYIISKYPYVAKKVYILKDFKKIGNFDTSENPDIEDPIAKDIDFYRKTFAVIKESIDRALEQI